MARNTITHYTEDGDDFVLNDGKRVPRIEATKRNSKWKDWSKEQIDWLLRWYAELTMPEMEEILRSTSKTLRFVVEYHNRPWNKRPIAKERARLVSKLNAGKRTKVKQAKHEPKRHKYESINRKLNKTLDDKMRNVRTDLPIMTNKVDVLERARRLITDCKCSTKCVSYGRFPCNNTKQGDTCYDVIRTKIYELNCDWEPRDLDPRKKK